MLSISVIIPHRNDADGLARALQSVREQTCPVAQTIVVDDSSDPMVRNDLLSTIDFHREHGFNTILISNDRRLGPGPSRNLGWDASESDLVAFLDSDDEWHPSKIEAQVRLFENFPFLSLACHRFALGDWDKRQPDLLSSAVKSLRRSDWLVKNWAPTSTVMLRASTPFKFAEDRHFSEDYELWLNIALSGASTCYLESTLARPDKPAYGHSGLSQALVKMERGELRGIKLAMRNNNFGAASVLAVQLWSILKFLIRVLRVFLLRRPAEVFGGFLSSRVRRS